MAYTTIDDPTKYFNTVLYSADASTNISVTVGHQPDFVWIKRRNGTANHVSFDSVRGTQKGLFPDITNAEATEGGSRGLTSFDSNGFTIGPQLQDIAGSINAPSGTYVSWNWLAGGSASSNSNGSITSSVSASTTAGFSIVSYTGTGANATVGHGLGAAPTMIIQKNRIDGQPWWVYHSSIGAGGQLRLSGTDAEGSDGGVLWNSTAPTSTVFSLGDNGGSNGDSDACIAYCFVDVKGYSKIGSYTGNNDNDGTFVYTGFRPAWVMIKRTDSAQHWFIFDNKRDTDNPHSQVLLPSSNGAEETITSPPMDFLSNGFKLRYAHPNYNSAASYIYMAFADRPFVSSNKEHTNAR